MKLNESVPISNISYILQQKDASHSPFPSTLLLATNSLASQRKSRSHLGRCPSLFIIKSIKPPALSPTFSGFLPIIMQTAPLLLSRANLSSSTLDSFFSSLVKDSAPSLSFHEPHYLPFSNDRHKNRPRDL